jgi:hypothetical protein
MSPYYILPMAFTSSYCFFVNFPFLLKIMHSKPSYYDDLEDPLYVDSGVRKRFQHIFIIILQIILSIAAVVLAYYYMGDYNNTYLSTVELFGVFGGFVVALIHIGRCFGIVLIFVLNIQKNSSNMQVSGNTRKLSASLDDFVRT